MRCACVLLIAIFIALSLATPENSSRERETRDEYLDINGELYYVMATQSMTPSNAEAYCNTLNMTLMDLNNPGKEMAIYNSLVSHGYTRLMYWTSGQRLNNGSWVWMNTGNLFTYTNWLIGEPASALDFVYFDSFRYGWVGNFPNASLTFVCQERPPSLLKIFN